MNYDLFLTFPILNMIKYGNLSSGIFIKILEFFLKQL